MKTARTLLRRTARLVVVVPFATLLCGPSPVLAQVPGGAFERLSPGNQKIARSLYDAQRRDLPVGRRLTLDQIGAKKGTEGWGNVFKDMKSQGLVTQKNLGQVISREEGRPAPASGAVTGANRAHDQGAEFGNPAASVRGHSDDVSRGGSMSSGNAGGGHGRGR